MMEKSSLIYVAGHRGLVGSAIYRELEAQGYTNLVGRSRAELDLTDSVAVRQFMDEVRPEYVFLAAARVGGIMANNIYRADFLSENLAIQQNVIMESHRIGVKKLLFLGSTCIYPKEAPQPMSEDCLLTSALEYTNEPYAIAKIAGLKLCESLNLQYGTNFIAAMPTNLYGPRDNFDLVNSHVLPAMVRKLHLSKALAERAIVTLREDLGLRPIPELEGDVRHWNVEAMESALAGYGVYPDRVELWGTGKPMREFLWSEDMAKACIYLMEEVDSRDLFPKEGELRNAHINIGTGQEIALSDLAGLIAREIGYRGRICFNADMPDGTMRKLTDPSKLHRMGWYHLVELPEGIHRLYQWYLEDIEVRSSAKG